MFGRGIEKKLNAFIPLPFIPLPHPQTSACKPERVKDQFIHAQIKRPNLRWRMAVRPQEYRFTFYIQKTAARCL
jgi:hypothetical protein